MEDNPVRRAVDTIGGILETQIAVRVNYWTLREWLKSGVVPTTRYAVALSEATHGAVSVKELAGLGSGNGDDGDKPRRFQRGRSSVTCLPPGPAVPRFPDTDTAAQAA